VEAASAFQQAATLSSRGGPANLRAAVAAYDAALAQWHDLGDGLQEALSALRLGRTYFDLGEVATALRCYERSLELLQTSEVRGQEAGALASIAPAYRLSGQLERALAANQRALEIYRDLKSVRGQASSLHNLALVYQNMGEIEKSLEHYERALALWQQLDEPANQGYTLHSMGTLYALLGKDAESLDLLNRALEMRRRTGDRSNQAVTLAAIGWGHYLLGEPEAAVGHLEEALRLHRAVGNRRGEATTLDRLATALVTLERRPQALAAYQQAETILRQVGERLGLANTLANLGLLYEGWGRPRRALVYFQEALPLLAEVGDRNALAAALTGLARARRALGDLEAARVALVRALELLESVRRTADRVGLRSSLLASRYDTYELYVDLLMELHRKAPDYGWDARALQAAEGARAQGLLTMLRDVHAEIGKKVDPGLLERRRALGEKVNAAAAPAETRSLLLELEKLRAEIRRQSPGYAALTDPEPLTVEEVRREMLDRETALLYFALGEERSFVWLLTPGSLVSRALPPRREIEAAARRAHRLLAASHQRPAWSQARAATAKLAEMLLGPLAGRLDSRRLWLVPDGALHYVPFGALPLPPHPLAPSPSLPSATGRRGTRRVEGLLADHEIVRVPSLAVLLALRREVARRRPAPQLLAVLADPVFGGAFSPLAHSRDEAHAILDLVPPEDRLAALGFAARRETVSSGELSRYRILHFATHALLDAEQPELSGIVFSLVDEAGRPQDGLLRTHEIYDLELPAELVVLSACQTALGKEVRGEGLVGLAGGLLYAGAARVVVSLWSVSDRATAELMHRFYRGMLEEGMPPAAALRQAQLSMAQEPQWRAPYFWAGFVLLGEREGSVAHTSRPGRDLRESNPDHQPDRSSKGDTAMSSEGTKKKSGAEADPPPDQPDPAKTAGSRGLPDQEDQAEPGASGSQSPS
jgi:CHAT domain-containing protein